MEEVVGGGAGEGEVVDGGDGGVAVARIPVSRVRARGLALKASKMNSIRIRGKCNHRRLTLCDLSCNSLARERFVHYFMHL